MNEIINALRDEVARLRGERFVLADALDQASRLLNVFAADCELEVEANQQIARIERLSIWTRLGETPDFDVDGFKRERLLLVAMLEEAGALADAATDREHGPQVDKLNERIARIATAIRQSEEPLTQEPEVAQ